MPLCYSPELNARRRPPRPGTTHGRFNTDNSVSSSQDGTKTLTISTAMLFDWSNVGNSSGKGNSLGNSFGSGSSIRSQHRWREGEKEKYSAPVKLEQFPVPKSDPATNRYMYLDY